MELIPTRFHRRLCSVLPAQEPGLWSWYSSDAFRASDVEQTRLEILKRTYRLEPSGHPGLYESAQRVSARLALAAPAAFYQVSGDGVLNAGLCFIPGEVHVILAGPITTRLEGLELEALLGHELSHFRLWTEEGGRYRTADSLTEAVASQLRAPPSWVQLAIRHRLYTEIYADRGSLVANGGDLLSAIRCLVKVSTGAEHVDAQAYLRQVDEVLEKSQAPSAAESHPEIFLRAWAMKRWLEVGAEAEEEIALRIEGQPTLETLDLLAQLSLTRQTRALIERYRQRLPTSSEAVDAHARQFFPQADVSRAEAEGEPGPAGKVPPSVADYFGYVLLDLATADGELGEVGLATALQVSDDEGFGAAFDKLVRKELKVTAASLTDLRSRWPSFLPKATGTDAP